MTELSGQHCFNGLDERALGLATLNRLDDLTVHEELAGVAPAEWTTEQIKRRVRNTHRCMLEVY